MSTKSWKLDVYQRSQKFCKVIGLVSVLIATGPAACSEEAEVQNNEASKTLSSWPAGWTPLLIGPDESVIYIDQKIIAEFDERFWVELFVPPRAPHGNETYALAAVSETFPSPTGEAGGIGDQNDIEAWYSHFDAQQSLERHSQHLYGVTKQPAGYTDALALLNHAGRVLHGMASSWYFEVDEGGRPDGIIVCREAEVVTDSSAGGKARCINLFRSQGLTFVVVFGAENLNKHRFYRNDIINTAKGKVLTFSDGQDDVGEHPRYDFGFGSLASRPAISSLALRPAFGSNLNLIQEESLRGIKTNFSIGFELAAFRQNGSFAVSEDLEHKNQEEAVTLSLTVYPVLRKENGDVYHDIYDSMPTSCSSSDYQTRAGESRVYTTCEFQFHYNEEWVVRVFYRSPVLGGLPIEVKMITEYLDSIATKT